MPAPAPAFYVTGGTLGSEAASYVVRHADATLYSALTQGEFCYVLTARQMGKSSLIVRTAQRLRAAGVAVAVLDLTELGSELTREQWYVGLLARLGEQLEPDDPPKLDDALAEFWDLHVAQLGPVACWFAALQEVVLPYFVGPVVLFVDEVDYVRSLPFATAEFFAMIRACYDRRAVTPRFTRLTFCLLGVITPTELIADPQRTPFNIGRRIELTDFTPTEAAPLATGLGCAPPLGAGLVRRMLAWTGGHPYLTQRLCQAVAEDGHVTTPAGVDRVCQAVFLTAQAQEQDRNLPEVRKGLLRDDGDQAQLLTLYAQVRRGKRIPANPEDPLHRALALAGLTRVVHGRLRVRNRLYARVFDRAWLRTHLPEAAQRAKRKAFWRRVTATAAAVLLLGGSGLWYWDAYYRPHIAYYADSRERYDPAGGGNPEGVGPVTAAAAQQRLATQKWSRRGRLGPVTKIEYVNGYGRCPETQVGGMFGMPAIADRSVSLDVRSMVHSAARSGRLPDLFTTRVCHLTYERDAAGRVSVKRYVNRDHQLVYEEHIDHDRQEIAYKDAAGRPHRLTDSGATKVHFTWYTTGPHAGLLYETHYLDRDLKPQPDAFGLYGTRSTYDARGFLAQASVLGADGTPTATPAFPVARMTFTRDAQGRQTESASFDAQGQPTPGLVGSPRTTTVYDAYGNPIRTASFDAQGQPVVPAKLGYHGSTTAYNSRGQPIRTASFDAQGQPMLSPLCGCATLTMAYDTHGEPREVAVWGPDGHLVLSEPMGYAKSTMIRDARGQIVELALWGPDGQLLLHPEFGFAKQTAAYDARGEMTAQAFWGPDGQLVLNPKQGFAKFLVTRNAQGQPVEFTFLGPDNRPVLVEHYGFAQASMVYDARGNVTERAYFGPDGHPIFSAKAGCAKHTATYTKSDPLLTEAYWDVDGQLLLHAREGYAQRTRTYNAQGHVLDETYVGPDGQPMLRYNRYARVTFAYDQAGRLREATLWDLAGRALPPAQVTLDEVPPDSQAARYLLQKGDIIEHYHGRAVLNSFSLDMQAHTPGEGRRALHIRRGNDVERLQVDPGDLGVRLHDVWSPGAPEAPDDPAAADSGGARAHGRP